MPRKPTGKPTGRPKKPADPADPESLLLNPVTHDTLATATPATAAPLSLIEQLRTSLARGDAAMELPKTLPTTKVEWASKRVEIVEKIEAARLAEEKAASEAAAKIDAPLRETIAQQEKTIARLEMLEAENTGLRAFRNAVSSEELRAAGQKAQDDKLAQLAEQARKDKAAKDEKIAAFIVVREEHKAECERRRNIPLQNSAEDPNSAEDGASRQSRIARENNEQVESDSAYFEDYDKNWKGRTEPPPPLPELPRESWAHVEDVHLTNDQYVERGRVRHDRKATDQDKRRVGLLPRLLRPGF